MAICRRPPRHKGLLTSVVGQASWLRFVDHGGGARCDGEGCGAVDGVVAAGDVADGNRGSGAHRYVVAVAHRVLAGRDDDAAVLDRHVRLFRGAVVLEGGRG